MNQFRAQIESNTQRFVERPVLDAQFASARAETAAAVERWDIQHAIVVNQIRALEQARAFDLGRAAAISALAVGGGSIVGLVVKFL